MIFNDPAANNSPGSGVNNIPRPFGLAVARMKKTHRERMVMSPSESKAGNALALLSPSVNMAGDVFFRK
jgi:hypothetical protein